MSVKNLSCPYCKKRTTRDKLVNHIDYNHSDQLPDGFTALRMAFHVANNKPLEYRRPCRICKQPTEWDEKKGRYNFLCGNPLCKEKYIAFMKQSMGEKYGAYRPTATPEGLEKMLAARKISGKYKWSDGTIFTYTGSYELATLKFMDKGLEIKSEDLMVPGPILEYEYNGQKHLYITDMYYRPYNLLIEVKDGGRSVNKNKEYAETRAKQIAKEKYVIEKTDYNYIRLTDKDCAQLMAVLADLKMHLIEHDNERVIHVNESTPIASINPIIGFNPDKDVVIVNYMKKKTFTDDSDYAIADSPKFDTIYSRDRDGVLRKMDKSILLGSYYTPYIVRGKRQDIVEALYNNKDKYVSESFIYETVFGHPIYSKNQIKYENCEVYEDYYQGLEDIKNYIIQETSKEASTFDKNFVKKTDKEFKFMDISNSSINSYLRKDNHIKGVIDWYKKAGRSGEVAIDKESDTIVGYIIVKDDGTIGPLYIGSKFRGYGISNTLMKDAVNKFGGKELGVYKDNEVAINLYKKFGFKKKETKTEEKTGEKYIHMIRESSDFENTFMKVEEFNNELNKFKYNSKSDKTLTSSEFEKNKAGTCWDYVNYEYNWFKKNGISSDAYIFVMQKSNNPNDIVTHTFCIITIAGEKLWFESAWKKWKGIYQKDLNGVVSELVDYYGNHSYSVFKYTPGFSMENIDNDKFMDKATQNLVKDKSIKESTFIEAVKYTRDQQKKWETKHGFDPKEDLNKSSVSESFTYDIEDIINEALVKRYIPESDISKPYFIKSKDGINNACVRIKGFDHPFRARSVMLLLKYEDNNWKVFLHKKSEKNYDTPGGGWDPGESPMQAAIRETQEECFMNSKLVKHYGHIVDYSKGVRTWVKDNVENKEDWWYGYYTEIFVGIYDSKFTGKVAEHDKDIIAQEGRWQVYDKVKYHLIPEYKQAVDSYLKQAKVSDAYDSSKVTEKDIEKNANLKPVFVVSTFTNTQGGKLIKTALGSKFSHSLISFTPELGSMYTFDNSYDERESEDKPKEMKGLTIDNFKRYKEKLSDGDMRVICIMTDDKTYKAIKDGVDYYVKHRDETKYSLKKLVKWVFGNNKLSSFGDMSMFCSEFVDTVLKNAKIDISGRSSSNTSPLDLGSFKDRNNFFQVYEGKISNYDPDKVKEQIEEMKTKIKNKDLKSQTKNSMKDSYDHRIKSRNHLPEITSRGINTVKNKITG